MAALAPGRHIAVIGLGCIGGSLALALEARGARVLGWSRSPADRAAAAAAGVRIAPADTLESLLPGAGIVVLAVPIAAVQPVARAVVATVPPDALVVHTAGLQSARPLGFDRALESRVWGTHPLAGCHASGFEAARPELFAGCMVSLDAALAAPDRTRAEWLWHEAGASRFDYRGAVEHDRLVAWVSQLPQLAATALAATLAGAGFSLGDAGPGARDTTRLAASDYGVWGDLLRAAPGELGRALEAHADTLRAVRLAVDAADATALRDIWERARAWRRAGGAES